MVQFWVIAVVLVPLAFIIGVAASTISYTSWSIVVPLLFVGFGFDLYESLYFAIILDLVNGLVLVGNYAKKKKIAFHAVLIWAGPMVVAEIASFYLLQAVLASHTDFLKGGINFFVLGSAVVFLFKGYQGTGSKNRSQKHQKKGKTHNYNEEDQIIENSDSPHEKMENSLPSSPTKQTFTLFDRFDAKVSQGIRISALLLGIGASGVLSGFLGIGAGMNYTLLFLFFLNFDLLKATGTGSLMMSIAMGVAAILFYNAVNLSTIWQPLLLAVCFSGMGTFLGAKWALRLSRAKLNYLVGSALLITGTISTIQFLLIS